MSLYEPKLRGGCTPINASGALPLQTPLKPLKGERNMKVMMLLEFEDVDDYHAFLNDLDNTSTMLRDWEEIEVRED